MMDSSSVPNYSLGEKIRHFYKFVEQGINEDVHFLKVDILYRFIVKISGSKPEPSEVHLIHHYASGIVDQPHLNHFYRLLVVILEGFPITQQVKLVGTPNIDL